MSIWLIVIFIAIVALGIFIANNSQSEFVRIYKENKKVKIQNDLTVEEFLENLKTDEKLSTVSIVPTDVELQDSYSRHSNTVFLSFDTLTGRDLASFCIVAHEFGHAEQNADEDKKYMASNKIRKMSKILGAFTVPLAIVGFLFLVLLENNFLGWFLIGISIFSLILILISNLLITVVEFDASKRALALLSRYNVLNEAEMKKARKFLKGAGYTYLGNFCSTLFIWTFLVPNPKIV